MTDALVIEPNPDEDVEQAKGRWYLVSKDLDYYSMERLVGWTVGRAPGGVIVVLAAVGAEGGVVEIMERHAEHHVVAGDDCAPDGRTWADVYNATPYSTLGARDVSGAMKMRSR